jgi:4-nitrophenyl phosphatase
MAEPPVGPMGGQPGSLEELTRLARVRCYLLDMDGTFYLGDRLLEGALHFVGCLKRRGRDYLFLTNNSSKRGREYADKISRLGLPVPESKVFTSGEATALYLNDSHPGARVFLLGTPSLIEEFRLRGIRLDADAPDLVVLGFDTTLTYDKIRRMCDLVRAGLPFIATHADFNCPTPDGPTPDVGSMLAMVKAATGREPDLVVGKPNRMIVDAAAHKLGLPVDALGMIGDRLYTDIALGQTAGIATILVLSGETRREDLSASTFRPSAVFEDLEAVARWLETLPD